MVFEEEKRYQTHMCTFYLPDLSMDTITRTFEDAVVPITEGPIKWRMLADVDVREHPLAALDTIVECFEHNPLDGSLHCVLQNLAGASLSPEMRVMFTNAVVRGVLTFMGERSRVNRHWHALSHICLDYRVWDDVMFRVGDGIGYLVEALRYVSIPAFRRLTLRILEDRPEHLIHCPGFAEAVAWMLVQPSSRWDDFLAVLFRTHAVECLLLLSRMVCQHKFARICMVHLPRHLDADTMKIVRGTWVDRMVSNLEEVEEPTTDRECPITLCPMVRPCIASDGFTYEQGAIMNVLSKGMPSPMTRERLDIRLVPNLRLSTKQDCDDSALSV